MPPMHRPSMLRFLEDRWCWWSLVVKVPLPCGIIGESNTCVRIRILPVGWEMDVQKKLILAVEEQISPADNFVN